jgi:hypothetical protein
MKPVEPTTLVWHPVFGERIVVEVEPDAERDEFFRQRYGDGTWTILVGGPVTVDLFGKEIETHDLRYFGWDELARVGEG